VPSIGLPAGDLLRPLRDDDVAPYVQAFRDDPAIGIQLGIEDDPDEDRLRGRIARLPQRMTDGVYAELAIGDPFAGSLTLHSVDWQNRRAEVGFFVVGRLGFTREGLLRSRNLERGRRVDVVWFGILRDEWASRT
jgi:RimJ/RimL family protein N-acetyltransferase